MSNDLVDLEIDKLFEDIKDKIIGGSIFGKEICEYDIKTMVVASYYLGSYEYMTDNNKRQQEHFKRMLSGK